MGVHDAAQEEELDLAITQHATDRGRERMGLPSGAIERLAQRAWKKGLTLEETAGSLNRFLTHLYMTRMTANQMRVWNNQVWVFVGETLVTVFHLPRRFHPVAQKLLKRKKERA